MIIKNLGREEAINYAGKQLVTNVGFYAALLLYQTGRATYKGIKSDGFNNGINNLVDKVKGSDKGSLGNSVDTKGVSKASKIDVVNDADIILNVKNIRQSLPSRYKTSGNLATAEVSID